MGFGTEKLEEDLKLFFPDARIQRMDLDTTRRKYSYQKIINDFENGDIDILVGTQMVSKGLDFDRVSLVGIVEVDRMLHFPDFRSHERTFQLSVQVSGRAGRKETPGKVIIQSADVQQLILKQIRNQDYRAFYLSEITDRDKFKYPPFYRLIKIIMKHKDKEVVDKGAERVTQMMRNRLGEIEVLGPYEPVISRIRNLYLMEGIIKIPRAGSKLKSIKEQLLYVANKIRQDKLYKQLWIVFDVDPL
jgi:primosomal protein N' (replication factor Y)